MGYQVCYLEATVFGTTPAGVLSMLDPIIDVAFRNAQEAEADHWIQISANVPDAQTEIGGVHLELQEAQNSVPASSWRLTLTAA